MPIFEYRCQDCGEEFELLLQGRESPQCPHCKCERLERQLSVFAVGGRSRAALSNLPEACRTCGHPDGPGACHLQ